MDVIILLYHTFVETVTLYICPNIRNGKVEPFYDWGKKLTKKKNYFKKISPLYYDISSRSLFLFFFLKVIFQKPNTFPE